MPFNLTNLFEININEVARATLKVNLPTSIVQKLASDMIYYHFDDTFASVVFSMYSKNEKVSIITDSFSLSSAIPSPVSILSYAHTATLQFVALGEHYNDLLSQVRAGSIIVLFGVSSMLCWNAWKYWKSTLTDSDFSENTDRKPESGKSSGFVETDREFFLDVEFLEDLNDLESADFAFVQGKYFGPQRTPESELTSPLDGISSSPRAIVNDLKNFEYYREKKCFPKNHRKRISSFNYEGSLSSNEERDERRKIQKFKKKRRRRNCSRRKQTKSFVNHSIDTCRSNKCEQFGNTGGNLDQSQGNLDQSQGNLDNSISYLSPCGINSQCNRKIDESYNAKVRNFKSCDNNRSMQDFLDCSSEKSRNNSNSLKNYNKNEDNLKNYNKNKDIFKNYNKNENNLKNYNKNKDILKNYNKNEDNFKNYNKNKNNLKNYNKNKDNLKNFNKNEDNLKNYNKNKDILKNSVENKADRVKKSVENDSEKRIRDLEHRACSCERRICLKSFQQNSKCFYCIDNFLSERAYNVDNSCLNNRENKRNYSTNNINCKNFENKHDYNTDYINIINLENKQNYNTDNTNFKNLENKHKNYRTCNNSCLNDREFSCKCCLNKALKPNEHAEPRFELCEFCALKYAKNRHSNLNQSVQIPVSTALSMNYDRPCCCIQNHEVSINSKSEFNHSTNSNMHSDNNLSNFYPVESYSEALNPPTIGSKIITPYSEVLKPPNISSKRITSSSETSPQFLPFRSEASKLLWQKHLMQFQQRSRGDGSETTDTEKFKIEAVITERSRGLSNISNELDEEIIIKTRPRLRPEGQEKETTSNKLKMDSDFEQTHRYHLKNGDNDQDEISSKDKAVALNRKIVASNDKFLRTNLSDLVPKERDKCFEIPNLNKAIASDSEYKTFATKGSFPTDSSNNSISSKIFDNSEMGSFECSDKDLSKLSKKLKKSSSICSSIDLNCSKFDFTKSKIKRNLSMYSDLSGVMKRNGSICSNLSDFTSKLPRNSSISSNLSDFSSKLPRNSSISSNLSEFCSKLRRDSSICSNMSDLMSECSEFSIEFSLTGDSLYTDQTLTSFSQLENELISLKSSVTEIDQEYEKYASKPNPYLLKTTYSDDSQISDCDSLISYFEYCDSPNSCFEYCDSPNSCFEHRDSPNDCFEPRGSTKSYLELKNFTRENDTMSNYTNCHTSNRTVLDFQRDLIPEKTDLKLPTESYLKHQTDAFDNPIDLDPLYNNLPYKNTESRSEPLLQSVDLSHRFLESRSESFRGSKSIRNKFLNREKGLKNKNSFVGNQHHGRESSTDTSNSQRTTQEESSLSLEWDDFYVDENETEYKNLETLSKSRATEACRAKILPDHPSLEMDLELELGSSFRKNFFQDKTAASDLDFMVSPTNAKIIPISKAGLETFSNVTDSGFCNLIDKDDYYFTRSYASFANKQPFESYSNDGIEKCMKTSSDVDIKYQLSNGMRNSITSEQLMKIGGKIDFGMPISVCSRKRVPPTSLDILPAVSTAANILSVSTDSAIHSISHSGSRTPVQCLGNISEPLILVDCLKKRSHSEAVNVKKAEINVKEMKIKSNIKRAGNDVKRRKDTVERQKVFVKRRKVGIKKKKGWCKKKEGI